MCFIKHNPFKHALLFLFFVVFLLPGCGKRKPPLPPVERVAQHVEITGTQIGDRIDIEWTMPARNAGTGNTLNISRADIYRLAEGLDEPLSLTEAEFSSRSTLIGSIPITDADFGLKKKTYSDRLKFAGQAVRLRYAIRFVNAAGQKAGFSNFFLIEPSPKIALGPSDLSVKVAQEQITVAWKAPAANVDGSTPANILGYNVFRIGAASALTKLTEKPVTDTKFFDVFFEFGKKYRYFVRTVSLGSNAESVESFDSETVEVTPVDTFAPKPPEAITIASAPSVISIFFAVNTEKDIAGYRIYRSTDRNTPLPDWKLMTPNLLKSNTFQDSTTRPNVPYFYYITAVDNAGNVSAASNVVTETAL
jgi:hypothetical protein